MPLLRGTSETIPGHCFGGWVLKVTPPNGGWVGSFLHNAWMQKLVSLPELLNYEKEKGIGVGLVQLGRGRDGGMLYFASLIIFFAHAFNSCLGFSILLTFVGFYYVLTSVALHGLWP